jgi:N-sulfoglucosamine sulfohydrolase
MKVTIAREGIMPSIRAATAFIAICLVGLVVGCGSENTQEAPPAAIAVADSSSSNVGQPRRPNILLLMAEDMSARVGAFGDTAAITPNLDELATEGVRYPNTFTTAGVCAPSRAAHILGMHQISTGTQHMRTTRGPLGTYAAVPPEHAKAYPELLRAAGYYTYTDRKLDYQFSGPTSGSGPFTIWDSEGGAPYAGWRKRTGEQPFFGMVNFAVTHESGVFRPLGSWPKSVTHFVMQVLRAFGGTEAPELPPVNPETIVVPPYFPDTELVRADMTKHYQNISVMDWQVGQVLDGLEKDGLADSTIVIWTTDHGDGLPRSKRELYDTGIKVPMIIRWPEAFRPADVSPGSLDTRMVSFVDMAPTILTLAGVKVPEHLQGTDFVNDLPREYIYASRDRIDEVPDRQRAVRDSRYKYIRSWHPDQPGGHRLNFRDNIDMMEELHSMYAAGELNAQQRLWFEAPGEERLFDVVDDPYELNDLSKNAEHAETMLRLRDAMEAWRARVGDWSEQSEAEMIEGFLVDGEAVKTPEPSFVFEEGKVVIAAEFQSSIGFSVDDGAWQLYSAPFRVPAGTKVKARAVRYGWQESDEVMFDAQ